MGGYVPPHMRQGDGGGGGGRRRGAGGRAGSDNNRNRQPSAPATPDAAVQDAIKRKDAAERKLGKEGAQGAAHAASTLASIADELRSALASAGESLSPSARSDAGLALGEALCAAAAASITASRHGPLSPELARAENDTRASAAAMYEDAYVVLADLARWCETQIKSHHSQNHSTSRREWADATLAATTAAANALAARGDVSALNTRDALARAVDTYESAAALSKAALDEAISSNDPTSSKNAAAEDLLAGLWNLADAKVKLAEASAEHAVEATVSSTVTSIEAMFQAAFQTYEEACQRCDSRAGDDLAGLLMDWGVAYASLAQILVDKVLVPSTNAVPVTWDAAVAARAIASCDGALEKLGKSAEFGAGDVAAHVAFGEARRTKSEIYQGEAKVYQLCAREHDPAYGRAVAEADGALAAATDPAANFGFGKASRLDSSNADALIGAAECHVERGRMHKKFGPDVLPSVMCEYDAHVSSMRSHFARGWELYARALDLAARANPRKDPGWASDRLEVAYNAACAACLAGELDTARGLLESVVACGGATKEVIDADADLDALRG